MRKLAKLSESGWKVLVVGDTKTPVNWHLEGVEFLSIDRQKSLYPELSELVPEKHYSRKNLGYVYAINNGAQVILETDDDNIPYEGFGENIEETVSGKLVSGSRWLNIYKHFTDKLIWPRGLPLRYIHVSGISNGAAERRCAIQQYLADGDPDVDAIHRLIFKNGLHFDSRSESCLLDPGCWSPFNSQNTVFFGAAFPCLYLPCFVSFRMTDIWRSFVAQSVLWARKGQVAFHSASVIQERNEHDLMEDFQDEVDGYLHNEAIAAVLEASLADVDGNSSMNSLTRRQWLSLADNGFVSPREIDVLDLFFDSINSVEPPEHELPD